MGPGAKKELPWSKDGSSDGEDACLEKPLEGVEKELELLVGREW